MTSPVDAVLCLGTDMIAAIVLSQSLFRHYQALKRPEMDLRRVWTHSWETARLAQHICREKRLGAKAGEEAFLAGLMHEIGRFILIDNFPGPFQTACDGARQTRRPLAAGLRETLHASPLPGGRLCPAISGACPAPWWTPLAHWTTRNRARPTE